VSVCTAGSVALLKSSMPSKATSEWVSQLRSLGQPQEQVHDSRCQEGMAWVLQQLAPQLQASPLMTGQQLPTAQWSSLVK
jgi:hypothetical protein